MHEFFLTLSLCHTVHATEEEDDNAPYPYHYQVYTTFRAAERIRGARGKLYLGALWLHYFQRTRLRTGGQYSTALKIPLNWALNALYSPDFNEDLLNFRLFLKLGALSRLGARGKLPSMPRPLDDPDQFICNINCSLRIKTRGRATYVERYLEKRARKQD